MNPKPRSKTMTPEQEEFIKYVKGVRGLFGDWHQIPLPEVHRANTLLQAIVGAVHSTDPQLRYQVALRILRVTRMSTVEKYIIWVLGGAYASEKP